MPKEDTRVDAYISKSAGFARPILIHLRNLVHAACPDVEETMKWGVPFFDHNGVLCSMAAFKEHCTFGFWKGELVLGKSAAAEAARGQFGRLTAISDLPGEKILTRYIRRAVELNEAGIKKPADARPKAKAELAVPDSFLAALRKNKKALTAFENFSPSHRKEYVEWITAAKREETRVQRLQTALEWIAEGKSRHWKYR